MRMIFGIVRKCNGFFGVLIAVEHLSGDTAGRPNIAAGLENQYPGVMKVSENAVVTIDYTLTNDSGEKLDTSKGHDPLSYIHTSGNKIPGLEKELEGRSEGDHFTAVISPDEAYGSHDDSLVFTVPLEKLPKDQDLQNGMQFQTETPQGPRILTLTSFDDSQAVLDANHPLAGKTLHFDVTVRGIREATGDEIRHGHIHDGTADADGHAGGNGGD